MAEPVEIVVAVSEECRRFFQTTQFPQVRIYFTNRLRELAFDLLRDSHQLLCLAVAAPLDECSAFQDLFTNYSPQKLLYGFIIGDSEVSDPAKLEKLDRVIDFRTTPISNAEALWLTRRTREYFDYMRRTFSVSKSEQLMALSEKRDQDALISIGQALTIERDPEKLLRTILYMSKKITGADAGSIFLVEGKDDKQTLRFKYSHTFSKDLKYEEFSMPMDTNSIAGYAAIRRETLNLPDVYHLSPLTPFKFNSQFDRDHGYITRSMLVTPMVNHLGEPIGVIQLINSKDYLDPLVESTGNEAFEILLEEPEDFDRHVVPFAERYEELMKAVAAQAAIAIENSRMIQQIQGQFEAFVKASVTAIESRDPATSGHSFRVAETCLALAKAINEENAGVFKDVWFTPIQLKELQLAALLHDFGKVYIDLSVFMKAKKLQPQELEILKTRLALLHRTVELQYSGKPEKEKLLEQIQGMWNRVQTLNEPAVVSGDPQTLVKELVDEAKDFQITDLEGHTLQVFTPREIENLSIRRGSLNDEERKAIQSHVVHTWNFVKNIPWPEDYKNIPEIASKHHEMLDGSGYPWGLKAEDIPLPARIMAVADVFDALAARDRPYKKALPIEKCLAILQEEAQKNRLDPDLVELFIRRQIFEITQTPEFNAPRVELQAPTIDNPGPPPGKSLSKPLLRE